MTEEELAARREARLEIERAAMHEMTEEERAAHRAGRRARRKQRRAFEAVEETAEYQDAEE